MNDEPALILRVKTSGDPQAFNSLVKLHQGKIRAFLFRLCKNTAITDDLAQDTFLQAFDKISSFNGSGSFTSWLFQIAYSRFLQDKRRQTADAKKNDAYALEITVAAEQYSNITADELDLERAFLVLRSEEAAALTLNYGHGYSHSEIADILHTPIGTVKTNIQRGKNTLRQLLCNAAEHDQAMDSTERRADNYEKQAN